jgi:site-specific recombinase XerD
MQLTEAIKGHLLDLKISGASEKHIAEVKREMERFRVWCEKQGVMKLSEVSHIVLKGYIAYLQDLRVSDTDSRVSLRGKKVSPVTALDYMRKVRSFFFWAEREGYLEGPNPVVRIPKIKVPKLVKPVFTPEQMRDMLEACDVATPLGFRDYIILLVFLDSGIRVSELCAMTLDSVHEDYLLVFGKGSKEREVGISGTTSREVFKYTYQFRRPHDENEKHLFLSYRGKPLDRKAIWEIIHDAAERAGIKGVRSSPHTARHSFAKEWLVKGGDLASLSRLLGHTDIQTTQIYMKTFQSHEARSQHQRFSPVETNKLGRRSTHSRRTKKKEDKP